MLGSGLPGTAFADYNNANDIIVSVVYDTFTIEIFNLPILFRTALKTFA